MTIPTIDRFVDGTNSREGVVGSEDVVTSDAFTGKLAGVENRLQDVLAAIDAFDFTAGGGGGGGQQSNMFPEDRLVVNSDATSAENQYIVFKRGNGNTDAELIWNTVSRRFQVADGTGTTTLLTHASGDDEFPDFLARTPYAAPAITSFSVSAWNTNLADSTDAGGSRTFTWSLDNADNIQGNLTLYVNGRQVTQVRTTDSPLTRTLAANVLRTGQSATAYLTGTDTEGNTFRSPTATARVPDPVYFGSSAQASITAAGAATRAAYANVQNMTVAAWTGNRYIYFMQLASRPDITSIVVDGLDQFGAYAKQTDIQANGATYEVWRTNRPIAGSFFPGGYTARISR